MSRPVKKSTIFILLIVLALGSGLAIAQIAELKKDVIVIETPGKKSDGSPTKTVFAHKKHVDVYGATCETCHPAIVAEEGAPANEQNGVHEVCRKCHAKNKPGKSFVCTRCHVK